MPKTDKGDKGETLAKVQPPKISVLERRLQNPFGEPSAPVGLRDKSLTPRWFNAATQPDAIWRAKEKGWSGVTPAMVRDLNQIGTHVLSPDGYVARGERAQEVLMAMPTRDYEQIQAAKVRENLSRMGNPNAQRSEAANALGKIDPQGAEFLDKHARMGGGPVGGVQDMYERVEQLDPNEPG